MGTSLYASLTRRAIWSSTLTHHRSHSFVLTTIRANLLKPVQFYDNCQYEQAARVLSPLAVSDKLARPVLLDCLLQLSDTSSIIATFDPPESPAEAIALMDALWAEDKRRRLAEVLEIQLIDASTDASLIEMRAKYAARLRR